MKKMGRLLALLTVLSLLVSIFPAALAETHSFRDDIPTIDTVPTTITLPSEFELCKYFFVDDIYLQKAKFTAPSGMTSGLSPAARGMKYALAKGIMTGIVLALLEASSPI